MGQESGRAWLALLFRVSQNCNVGNSWTAFLSGTQDQIYLYRYIYVYVSVQFSSVTQSCLTLCNPMNCSMPGLLVHHQLPESPKPMFIVSGMSFNHLILCRPFLLLPSIFPSIRVFSNESPLRIRWPKYWSLSFNISPSNEHPGLISFRMD